MDTGNGPERRTDDRAANDAARETTGAGANPESGGAADRASGDRTRDRAGGRRRGRRGLLIGGGIALGLLVLTAGMVALVLVAAPGTGGTGGAPSGAATFEEEYVSGEGDEKIAVLPVQGAILPSDSSVGGQLPTSTPEGLRDALTQAEEDEGVEAVVLEVNSPGGGVTASDEMYRAIRDFQEEADKPVVVSMGTTAASGGYYISTPADSIVANETTLTGSLGVIIQLPNFSEAADDLGVGQEVIKSGEFKDIGSPFRELTPEERDIFQGIVEENFDRFVEVIVEGRGLPEEEVREFADGRVFSGQQALDLGLVDELGDLETAARVAREEAGIEEATLVRYTQTPGFADLLRLRLAPQPPEALRIAESLGLDTTSEPKYLYLPGA